MNWNKWIRQVHRWLSIIFTIGVILNVVTIFGLKYPQPPVWVGLSALIPLFMLLFSGLYMFALPYIARGRAGETQT